MGGSGTTIGWCGTAAALVAGWAVGPTPASAQIAWDDVRWSIEAADSRVERHEGRDALYLQNGTATLAGVDLRDGTVRFDLHASGALGFYGVAFRVQDGAGYEHVYVRPFVSGNPDATQYTPVFGGVSGWQIYAGSGFGGPLPVPTDRWIRFELRFRDGAAELLVEGERVAFPELQRAVASGGIALTASGAPARFADVVVSDEPPAPVEAPDDAPAEAPADVVGAWRLSTPVPESAVAGVDALDEALLDRLEWARVTPDVRGIVDIAKTRPLAPDANTVLAALTLRSDAARPVPLRFGFSDRVVVYLNGRPLYRGADGWRARDYKFLGTVGLFDEVILPLRRGDNEVILAVSESFGGWGVTAALPDRGGVEVVGR